MQIPTGVISALIGMIYDCVIDPMRWQATLLEICDELSFLHAVMSVYRIPPGVPAEPLTVPARLEQTWLDRLADYGPDMMAYWGGYDRLQSFPVDEPTAASRVVIAKDVIDNRFRREWIVPQRIVDLVGLPHARTPSLLGSIVFARHESIGIATDTDLATLRLIAPHIRRAVEISNLLDMKAIEASTFAATLETLAIGVVLVDARGAIVHGNAPARSMLDAKDPIRGERGVLKLASAASSAALEDAIRLSASNEATLGQRGIGVPLQCRDGSPCVLHVLPLKRGQIRPGLERRASAAVFIAHAAIPPQMPAAALAVIYDLTPAETRVMELLAEGKTQAEIGLQLGISTNTVKTHRRRVFEKTGASRQVELVRLLASVSLPI